MPVRPRLLIFTCLLIAATARADWKDDVGYTRLQQTFTTGVPTSVSGGVTQAEASDKAQNNYLPDSSNAEFTNKTITNGSSGSGTSGHATTVGAYFYGNLTSIIPGTTAISAFNANGWLGTDYLQSYGNLLPNTETRRVQNHSWIANYERTTEVTETVIGNTVAVINRHFDFAADRDGFVSVIGVNNGTSTTLPDLFCQTYHGISVGLVNGAHSAGLTPFDGVGRMKPDLVAFDGLTSFATPQVASAAGLISEKIRDLNVIPALEPAHYPRLTKALLLAGAAKDPLPSWNRVDSSNKPYDAIYGAGALNVFLAYRILAAGQQAASSSSAVAATGWDINTTRTNSRLYFFDIPAGTQSTRFSAALTWHRTVTTSTDIAGNRSWGFTLPNLDLQLYTASGTTLTSAIDASVSTVDNVEHIYKATLSPGRYALRVTANTNSIPYALAWRSSPTVTIAATTPTARELDGASATFTLTRTGPTTSALLVPLIWGGTATAGSHYIAPPASVLIPEGASTATVQITPIADALAQGDRTVTLAILTDYSLSAGTPANATVTIQDKPYDAWRFARFTTAELADTTISGESADPDADSLPNLTEYALNADPKTIDAPHTPIVGTADDRLTLTYTRPTTVTDVTYTVEWSGDLQTWRSGDTATETIGSTDNGNGTSTVVVRSVALLSTTPRQFLRLRASRL